MKRKAIKTMIGLLVGLTVIIGAAGNLPGSDGVTKAYASMVTDGSEAGDTGTDTDTDSDTDSEETDDDDEGYDQNGLLIESGVLTDVESGRKKVVVPDTVKEIASGAIGSSVTSIEISSSVKKINKQAFSNASSLKTITVAKKNAKFSSYKNCLYDKSKKTLLAVPAKSSSVSIYSKTKVIGSYAFNFCSKLKAVTLPKSVTTIKAYAFFNCAKLKKLTIYSSAKSISTKSFVGVNVSYWNYSSNAASASTKNCLRIYCQKDSRADQVAKKLHILTTYL